MPFNLFEYHTMGAGAVMQMPVGIPGSNFPSLPITPPATICTAVACPLGTSKNAQCQCAYPDGSLYQQPTPITPAGGGGSCNPNSVGKKFMINFPSGKTWTLSNKDDARARAFYCGSGGGGGGGTGGTGPIMDAIYCTGGEGAWDGTPTYWMNGRGAGCKTNDKGQSMPYGQQISREEYDRRGRTLCADGTYDENLNPWEPKCQGHGGYPGTVINPPNPAQNCPAPLGKQGLIQLAKQIATIDAMQERYGSMDNNSFNDTFGPYENCPFYSELVTTYIQARASAPRLPPIYQSR